MSESSSTNEYTFCLSVKSNHYRYVLANIFFNHHQKKEREHTIDCISNQNICEVNITMDGSVKFPNQIYTSGKNYSFRIYYFNKTSGGFRCEKDTLDFTIDKSIKFTLNVPPQSATMKGRKISDLVGVFQFNYPKDKIADSKKRSHESSNTSSAVATTSKKPNNASVDDNDNSEDILADVLATPPKMMVRSYSTIMDEMKQKEEKKAMVLDAMKKIFEDADMSLISQNLQERIERFLSDTPTDADRKESSLITLKNSSANGTLYLELNYVTKTWRKINRRSVTAPTPVPPIPVAPVPVIEAAEPVIEDPILRAMESLQKEYKNKAIELEGLTYESEKIKKTIEQINNTKNEVKLRFEQLILECKESEKKLAVVDNSINDKKAEIARIKERFTF
jgi:predicted NUDIX family NTP pyrophosphohydrolase